MGTAPTSPPARAVSDRISASNKAAPVSNVITMEVCEQAVQVLVMGHSTIANTRSPTMLFVDEASQIAVHGTMAHRLQRAGGSGVTRAQHLHSGRLPDVRRHAAAG